MSRQRLQTSTGEAVWHTKKDPPKAPLLPCAIFGLSGFVRWAPLWAWHEGERTSSDAQLAKPTTATPTTPWPRTGERSSAKAPRCRHSLARCQVEEAFAEAVFKFGVVAEATVAGGTFMSVGLADEGFCDCVSAMHVAERSARDKAPKCNVARTSAPPLPIEESKEPTARAEVCTSRSTRGRCEVTSRSRQRQSHRASATHTPCQGQTSADQASCVAWPDYLHACWGYHHAVGA